MTSLITRHVDMLYLLPWNEVSDAHMVIPASRCCLFTTVLLTEMERHEGRTRNTFGLRGALRHHDRDVLAADEDACW